MSHKIDLEEFCQSLGTTMKDIIEDLTKVHPPDPKPTKEADAEVLARVQDKIPNRKEEVRDWEMFDGAKSVARTCRRAGGVKRKSSYKKGGWKQ